MCTIKYYVYSVNLTDSDGNRLDERVKFSCSELRWKTLEKEIKEEYLMDVSTLRREYVTTDRNKARGMATEF